MTPTEIAAKLAMIPNLSAGELEGWTSEARRRGWFPGEMQAVLKRQATLKAKGGK
jgi:hypothetical protein